ncbi:MAG: class I SAM-dependent methyltransferase [Acidobacteriaceae bacterium]|nr:class I SAM-dependent methyltransferase [Acidobacteriaceae bacterium]
MINSQTQQFISERGEWTAMAIRLPDGSYTREPGVDHRLKRLVQCVQDFAGKPLAECRVLDLACLEGHYAIEFAAHGAEAVGIEAREASLDKCRYAKNALGLKRLTFFQDDVRNLSAAKYGKFDVVICSGILYHLPAQDAADLISSLADVCVGILLLDTFISLFGRSSVTLRSGAARGHSYFEHDVGADQSSRAESLWASIDNNTSFWFTEATLVNLLTAAGFTSVMEILAPTTPAFPRDRKTYLARRGKTATIITSEPTNAERVHPMAEGVNPLMDASQTERNMIFKVAKRVLPLSTKNAIKPVLRALRIMPADSTPEFMKKRGARSS